MVLSYNALGDNSCDPVICYGIRNNMHKASLSELFRVWGKIGLISFGGPAGQIALMHRVIVDEKKWLSERDYLNALSFCMFLPGPEAMQLATYSGWRLRGVLGGLISGLLFVLPGAMVVLGLAIIYALYGSTPVIAALFLGIKAAVLVIVLEALGKVARKSLKTKTALITAGLSFFGLFFLNLPFPLIILLAGLFGFLATSKEAPQKREYIAPVPLQRTALTALIWFGIWFVPLWAITALHDGAVIAQLGWFFSKLAAVTFGGAYSVLSYMAQDAVNAKEWLSAAEMMDGLGLAETTPGPLILVTEFVGFLAGARANGGFDIWMGIAAAAVTLWATFAPCFLWVFVGAPYIEWMSTKPRLAKALLSISAAVVGVILNLSGWFSLHVLFDTVERSDYSIFVLWLPDLLSVDLLAASLSVVAAIILLWLRQSVIVTILICAILGLAGDALLTNSVF